MRIPLVSLVATAALATSACGGGGGSAAPDAATTAGAPDTATDGGGLQPPNMVGNGPGISVADALSSPLTGPLLVNGYVVAVADETKLCELLAESLPPQCAGASVTLEGVDVDALEGVSTEGGVSWTPNPVQILGEVQDDVLVVTGR